MPRTPTCIGVDVGGIRKGFHAVALHPDDSIEAFTSSEPGEIASWCVAAGGSLVAVDAPCRWRGRNGVRAAELSLVRSGIRCFWTPTRRTATSHPTGFFDWMLAGERLYLALASTHRLMEDHAWAGDAACFETYPHAAACRLVGRMLDVRRKRADRMAVLTAAGIDATRVRSQDLLDAAVCAMVARAVATGRAEALGEARDGLILLPRVRRSGVWPTLARP
jgi:predicted nuclease with RNAse H fold